MNEEIVEATKPWVCPKCRKRWELDEAAWRAFDPFSPAFCPAVGCGAKAIRG